MNNSHTSNVLHLRLFGETFIELNQSEKKPHDAVIITFHPEEGMNVCTKFHGALLNSHPDIPLKPQMSMS